MTSEDECPLCAPHPWHEGRCGHVWPSTGGLGCPCRKSPPVRTEVRRAGQRVHQHTEEGQ